MWAAPGLRDWVFFGPYGTLNVLTRTPLGRVHVLQLASGLTVPIRSYLATPYITCLSLKHNFIPTLNEGWIAQKKASLSTSVPSKSPD